MYSVLIVAVTAINLQH